jgi:hypothetical protein
MPSNNASIAREAKQVLETLASIWRPVQADPKSGPYVSAFPIIFLIGKADHMR